ncbi:homoserine O-succinyltransferase, partial [Streptococcus pneumoniae]|nr:homoserine O-succinyltransferase [Streptococcus pneumoniae]
RYGVEKYQMDSKLSGIYPQDTLKEGHLLFRGFDDSYVSPHSRHTEISKEEVLNKTNLEILSEGPQVGVSILASRDLREIYSFGHLEYDRDTLAKEYFRDRDAGFDPHIPENYFKDDDVNQVPCLCWSSSAALFFSNWVNHAVYQETPFDWRKIEDDASAYG